MITRCGRCRFDDSAGPRSGCGTRVVVRFASVVRSAWVGAWFAALTYASRQRPAPPASRGESPATPGRVGLAVELTRRGAPEQATAKAGGWKSSTDGCNHYAAAVAAEQGAVATYL